MENCQIYISYRRKGGIDFAGRLADWFFALGYEVFYDVETTVNGALTTQISHALTQCRDVLLVLSPNALDRCTDEHDWMRQEIAFALKHNKNIIPVMLYDFAFPQTLPADIEPIIYLNGISAAHDRFRITVKRIEEHLISKKNTAPAAEYAKEAIRPVVITPYCGPEKYIFISYAHKDAQRVFPVIQHLQANGYRVWYDEGIDPGTEWDKNIAEHIVNCGYFIAFMSENYLDSSNCKDELNFARDLDLKRFLIYLEEVQLPIEMQMRLSRIQNIHKYSYADDAAFYQKLLQADGLKQFQD